MTGSRPISEHGLIGDLQTAALVATDGTIDWLCLPRFDSPSVFAAILDDERGGRFRIAPATRGPSKHVSRQMYFPDTAVLITRFLSEDGVGEVVDLMPVSDHRPTDRHRLLRIVRVVRGEMRFRAECAPRFDYGRADHEVVRTDGGVLFRSDGPAPDLALLSTVDLEPDGRDAHAEWTGVPGEVVCFLLECDPGEGAAADCNVDAVLDSLSDTVSYWRDWVALSTYHGRWREAVFRSAITLKLMTYAPTGALVAAPTTSLPEQVGGERNWDYRYTWVRDGSFSVSALLGLGYTEEALAFLRWLRDRASTPTADGSGPLKVMYRVDGTSELDEERLDHLRGHRGSTPVRIGNEACEQLQLDIYGEAMDALYRGALEGVQIGHDGWLGVTRMLDWLCEHWDQPEEGIWETRGGRKDFTFGRLMSWVALDRGLRMADLLGRPADRARWSAERDAIYRQVMDLGWSGTRGAFVQHYGEDVLDAANLLMPLVGFVSPHDPRWQSMLEAVGQDLVADSLVHRYDVEAAPDGLRGSEGTFSPCTFWYVQALARSGRLEQARLILETMLSYANHVGLYSEEVGATGEQLGNFPQAFTHLSLINAVLELDAELDRAPGRRGVPSGRMLRRWIGGGE